VEYPEWAMCECLEFLILNLKRNLFIGNTPSIQKDGRYIIEKDRKMHLKHMKQICVLDTLGL
jgi:hypothetical protein